MYSKAPTNSTNAMLGRAAQQAQRRKEEETNANNGNSTKRGSPATAAPSRDTTPQPEVLSAAYQEAPPRRYATSTTLLPGRVLGFPPVRGGKWRMATTDTLQEGMVAPAGVTASKPDEPARISPARQTPPPIRSLPTKPPPNAPSRLRRHPRRLTTSTNTRPRRPERSATRREQQHQGRAGGNHLHRHRARSPRLGTIAVADRTRQRGIPGHPWPG